MSVEHTYETADIRGLETALQQLHGFCADLQAQATAAASMATAAWSGIASVEFLGRVQTWQAGATALTMHAEMLALWAGEAATQYETAQASSTGMWGGGSGGGSAPVAV